MKGSLIENTRLSSDSVIPALLWVYQLAGLKRLRDEDGGGKNGRKKTLMKKKHSKRKKREKRRKGKKRGGEGNTNTECTG